MCLCLCEPWGSGRETKIKQEQVNTTKREGEDESKIEREYEHKCEKCMASRYLWSSKGGKRCIGLSYFMSLPDLVGVMRYETKKGERGSRGAGRGRRRENKWKKCTKLSHTISGYVPRLEYHETGWPRFQWTLSLSKLFWFCWLPWEFDNLFFNHILRGVINDLKQTDSIKHWLKTSINGNWQCQEFNTEFPNKHLLSFPEKYFLLTCVYLRTLQIQLSSCHVWVSQIILSVNST